MFLSPRDYARSRRRWKGAVPLSEFTRLVSEFGTGKAQVEIELEFYLDGNQRVRVKGYAQVRSSLLCKQCLNHVDANLHAEIDAYLMTSLELDKETSMQIDVIEYENHPVSIVELVEDDLIMSIPWRACSDDSNCSQGFTDDQSHRKEMEDDAIKPFADLRNLINESSEDSS